MTTNVVRDEVVHLSIRVQACAHKLLHAAKDENYKELRRLANEIQPDVERLAYLAMKTQQEAQ